MEIVKIIEKIILTNSIFYQTFDLFYRRKRREGITSRYI